MRFLFERIGSLLMFGLFLWLRLIPSMMSLKIMNYLKNKNKEYSAYIILSIISIIPTLIYLYLVYYALTCGSGCFNWIFFIISIFPILVLNSLIN